ncbi:MAG: hypothetical protein ACK56I_29490, partial [bacterium]
ARGAVPPATPGGSRAGRWLTRATGARAACSTRSTGRPPPVSPPRRAPRSSRGRPPCLRRRRRPRGT